MYTERHSLSWFVTIGFTCTFFCMLISTAGHAAEDYKFERMWPALLQPWYFSSPGTKIEVDNKGNAYILDYENDQVLKYTSEGHFISIVGGYGDGEGTFYRPTDITLDPEKNVYVSDLTAKIQKFTTNGEYITQWGSPGEEDGQFGGGKIWITVDNEGFLYALNNFRVQKFTSTGDFIRKWGAQGEADGQFNIPQCMAVDQQGNIYVGEYSPARLQKFNSNGEFLWAYSSDWAIMDVDLDQQGNVYITGGTSIIKLSPEGIQIDEFFVSLYGDWTVSVAVEDDGNILVLVLLEGTNPLVQLHSPDGQFISKWGAIKSKDDDKFYQPLGVAVDVQGNVYVMDIGYSGRAEPYLKKFNSHGEFIRKWGERGDGDGQFSAPKAVALDAEGNVYVLDIGNDCIHKFTQDGLYLSRIVGSGEGTFNIPRDIAVDGAGNLYVTDTYNDCVLKFSSTGDFLSKWDSPGVGDGQFSGLWGIAVDSQDRVYVTDDNGGNIKRVQVFNSEGQFITKWGSEGYGDGQFRRLSDIAIDNQDNIYVIDPLLCRIQKFAWDDSTKNVHFLSKWGERGIGPGQFMWNYAWYSYLAVGEDGTVYTSEPGNCRVQAFKPVGTMDNALAIVIAGGGPYEGNNLWDQTQMNANFAYRTLTYQGFEPEQIRYLSSNLNLDLDNNGESNVYTTPTIASVTEAISTWALDADSLVLYAVDHGGESTFRLNAGEILDVALLDNLLDNLQNTIPGRVIVAYDACESGTFVPELIPPPGKERVVVTSTSPGEDAWFITKGSVSYSNFFWMEIFGGLDVSTAHSIASSAMAQHQSPLLDADGNGIGNEQQDWDWAQSVFIGNHTDFPGDAPEIGAVSDPQTLLGENTATLFADPVTDAQGVGKVWAMIRPPNYNQGSSGNPVQNLPSIELLNVGGNRYEGTYNNFSIEGTYVIAIYARDFDGKTSVPALTEVTVVNPLRRRAVLAASGLPLTDPMWPAIEKNLIKAYDALRFQCYDGDKDIYFMSQHVISEGWDAATTLSNLSYALGTWAADQTQDVVVYLLGEGNEAGFTLFRTNTETEILSGEELNTWLDVLQASIPGRVTVIYDACQSGRFLEALVPPVDKERITLSSTGVNESAYFLQDGNISFSRFFWGQVTNGANVDKAFYYGRKAISRISGYRTTAWLDDNGNGIGNEKMDGDLAEVHTIGAGIILAGDEPLIGSIVPAQSVTSGSDSVTIWVEGVTTTRTIDRVWAVLAPPGLQPEDPTVPVTDLPMLALTDMGSGRYEGSYTGFAKFGTYTVLVYAMDTEGEISLPKETTVFSNDGPDIYEEDDSVDNASILLNNIMQRHNFHDAGDQDWVQFSPMYSSESTITYQIETSNVGTNCDTIIELYDTDEQTLLVPPVDDQGPGEEEFLEWNVPAAGIYYVKIKQYNPDVWGEDTGYDLSVIKPVQPGDGWLQGVVTDKTTGVALRGATVKLTQVAGAEAETFPNGLYQLCAQASTYTVQATKTGYITKNLHGVAIIESLPTNPSFKDIEMTAEGGSTIDCDNLNCFIDSYGSMSTNGNYNSFCDFDQDGDVDGYDLAEFVEMFYPIF